MLRLFLLLVLCGTMILPAVGEVVVERQGWRVLSFDVPGMELVGKKDGKTTRATYAKKVGEGEVKISVNIKTWLAIDTFEDTYREERTLLRASPHSRLQQEMEVPGAPKTLTYNSSDPYEAEVVVLYSKDFRCQLTVTSSKHPEAREAIGPTYQQLLATLKMGGLSPISPIRTE